MQVEQITVDREEARDLYLKYKAHQHYSTPIDFEIQRVYSAIEKGKVVIRAIDSIVKAGVGSDGLPKLAIVRAADDEKRTTERCFLQMQADGGARFSSKEWPRDAHWRTYVDVPPGSFAPSVRGRYHFASMVPIVPVHLRPRRGLANYHILFEAEWTKVVPKDPLLLRRIGRGDLWVVCAAWDLTDVERAVLAGRL